MEKKKKNKRDTSRSMWERVPYDGTRDKQEYKKKKNGKKKRQCPWIKWSLTP